MGAGKTTMMAEASDLLTVSGIAHVALDLDALGVDHLPGDAWKDLTYRSLALLWNNYAAAGATRLLLAEAIENAAELDQIRAAVSPSELIVCRLTAPLATMQQ